MRERKGREMRIGVDIQLSRRDIKRLHRLDRKLDRIQRRSERAVKGAGDFIGMTMAGIGLITFMLAVISADSVPTEMLDTWVFITLAGMLIGVGGCRLLGWMRE